MPTKSKISKIISQVGKPIAISKVTKLNNSGSPNQQTNDGNNKQETETKKIEPSFQLQMPEEQIPLSSYSISAAANDVFETANVSNTVKEFDLKTGIESDSPEILLFSDFVPCYDDEGFINANGSRLEYKQNAVLISANSSINSLLNSSIYAALKSKIDANLEDVRKFSKEFFAAGGGLLSSINSIKKKFDCRYPFDPAVLESLQLDSTTDYGFPSELDDLLTPVGKEVYSKWTSTKAWVQACLSLKSILRNGNLQYSVAVTNVNQEKLNSSYAYYFPQASNTRMYNFNGELKVTRTPFDFTYLYKSNNVNPMGESAIDITALSNVLDSLTGLYIDGVFSKKFSISGNESIKVPIEQMAYAICYEYSLSARINNASYLAQFGYTKRNNNNVPIWENLIGQSGKDITDIDPNPKGNGNSLISLAQSREPNEIEVLTFEDRYINDNIGTERVGSLLTPGTYYYLESTISSTGNTFDTTRMSAYLNKLNNAVTMLNDMSSCFDMSLPVPYGNDNQKVGLEKPQQSENPTPVVKDKKHFLSNPISLLRKIEEKVLNTSGILSRNSDNSWTAPIGSSPNGGTRDISGLLISLAVNDDRLRALLFAYACYFGKVTARQEISKRIIEHVSNFLVSQPAELLEGDFKMPIDLLQRGLALTEPDIVKVLTNIASFISEINEDFDSSQAQVSPTAQGTQGVNTSAINVISKTGEAKEKIESFLMVNNNFQENSLAQTVSQSGIDKNLTCYSGIQKTTFIAAIFELCCLLVHYLNPESFVGTLGGKKYLLVRKTSNTISEIVIHGDEKNPQTTYKYHYDKTMVEIENNLFNINQSMLGHINWFRVFVASIQKSINSLKSSLENNGDYNKFLQSVNQTLGDPQMTRLLMTQEQITLVNSKLHELSVRSNEDYSSPVKDLVPYFTNLQSEKDTDAILPIEDVGLVSWNLFLKQHLQGTEYRQSRGFNKKIISVGLPQKLYRSTMVNGSKLGFSSVRNGLIKIKLYRVDSLRPLLVHLPLEFLFDIRRFPTRLLENYPSASDIMNETSNFKFDQVPCLVASPNFDSFKVAKSYAEYFDENYSFLKNNEKKAIYENHTNSFLMEQYISFLTNIKVDEHRYTNYELLKPMFTNSSFDSLVQNVAVTNTTSAAIKTNPSANKFFTNETFLFDSFSNFKKSMIMPRKFDRVFHLVFDPDNFFIDLTKTDEGVISANLNVLELASKNGMIAKGIYKRKNTSPNEVSMDSYFVSFETYDSN